ncbi:MAG: hypothetical protein VX460_04020 [Planctomycetota bacterium]|nr:hypothetical protein [Planctomycetota bacterium]
MRVISAAVLAAHLGGASAATPSTATPSAGGEKRLAVAHWDGIEVSPDAEVPGLGEQARESIERWRTFAERRGYRVDLDEGQRVLLVSDSERFQNASRSLAIVESVLERTAAFAGPRETPVTILRASNETDASTARVAADGLGFGGHVFVYVETGSLRERRAVDARLAEAVVRAELTVHAPFLSEWMADGLASAIANETTQRGIVRGEAKTLVSVQSSVSKIARDRDRRSVDLAEVSGVEAGEESAPREGEAMAIVSFLRRHHETEFSDLVIELGTTKPDRDRPKYRDEEDALRRHCGLGALEEIELALRKGRAYRRR